MNRYEVSAFIGPCSEEEAIVLTERIIDLPEFEAVGGGAVALTTMDDNDPLFADPA